jgi:hypothetical protein
MRELNVSIWNNEEITSITGYAITDLTHCLCDLGNFISTSLQPNRLEGFDIDKIKQIEPFNQIPGDLDLKNL